MAELTDVRELVRERYAAAAREATGACCGPFGGDLYPPDDRDDVPPRVVLASLGCGNPTAVAELRPGETVLDLGSGGGLDVLLSARRVGPTGRAYGLDMTDEMLDLARRNQAEAGVENVEWLRGHIEAIPLPDASVDVVISNCVINLSADKPAVLREAARVLRPGGRLAVTDVIADPDLDASIRADMQAWTGCVAGALTRQEFERALAAAGLVEVEIAETHRVHAHAGSAIVRARKPSGLVVRAAGPGDAPFLLALRAAPATAEFLAISDQGEDELRAELAAAPAAHTGRFVGTRDGRPLAALKWTLVNRRSRIAEVSEVIVDPTERGRGVARAFVRGAARLLVEQRGVHRVQLEVYGDNTAAQRAFERAGFRREGVRRQAYWRRGAWQDGVLHGLLADELR